jgi:hypothetical protein
MEGVFIFEQRTGINVVKKAKHIYNILRPGTGYNQTAIVLAAFGSTLLIVGFSLNHESRASLLLMLSGIGAIAVAIIFFFFSLYRYIRSDVCDSMLVSNALSLGRILSYLNPASNAVYCPISADSVSAIIPISVDIDSGVAKEIFAKDGVSINIDGSETRGILLTPPGNGIFSNALGIGAHFSPGSLENSIKDVVENGLELASTVSVRREDGRLYVAMENIANWGMCRSIRMEDDRICGMVGCPICSSISCMVASGIGRNVRVEKLSADGGRIELIYEIL